MATRAKEDKFEQRDDKADLGRNVTQLDFFYTYTGEDERGEEGPVDKVRERSDQFGTCLVMASSETNQYRQRAQRAWRLTSMPPMVRQKGQYRM